MRCWRYVRHRTPVLLIATTGTVLLLFVNKPVQVPSAQHWASHQDLMIGHDQMGHLMAERQEQGQESSNLKCVDPEGMSGVQDLFCMKRPTFLSQYKNPCWIDWTNELQLQTLNCLPYFHVLGVDKCGTTDLHSRMAQHPQILLNGGGMGKETYYWCWLKYGQWMKRAGKVTPFGKYVRHFNKPKAFIAATKDDRGFHPLITGDGTPMDFWDFRAWPLIPQNRGLKEPVVLTPHLMRHVYRDPKFIVILRNPIDRLYSDYLFLMYGNSPVKFHKDVPKAVAMMEKCMKVNTTRRCVFSNDTYIHLPMRIHIGMYSVFMKEWLAVFPRSAFHILRTEDYHSNMTHHLSTIFRFLDVDSLPGHLLEEIVQADRKHETKFKKNVADMFPDTRTLLQRFYEPYNQELADLLHDSRFLWEDI